MTIQELNERYSKEFRSFEGDKEMRYYLLAPLFQNLYQNKVVYHDRFTGVIQLSDIKLSPDFFDAKAQLISVIRKETYRKRPLPQKWQVGANWKYLQLHDDYLYVYSGWLMWTDPFLVEKVEKLIQENNLEEAYNLTMEKVLFSQSLII